MAVVHLSKQRVELVDARQRNLFSSNGSALQSRCGIAVNYTSFDCDPENMPKQRDCVVVVSRRRLIDVGARPFFASNLRTLADFCFIQVAPVLDERRKASVPIIACARFDSRIVTEIAEMNRSSLAECHFA